MRKKDPANAGSFALGSLYNKEKNVTSAAKAQALNGNRVLTGTRRVWSWQLSLVVPALGGESRGRRAVPPY
jgi:hypothetical protein